MAVEIKKVRIGKLIFKHCEDGSGNRCRRDGQICNCSVYAGNPNYPNRFEAR